MKNNLKKTISRFQFFFCVCSLSILPAYANAEVCQSELPASEKYKEAFFYYPCNLNAPAPSLSLTGGYNNTYRNLLWMTEYLSGNGYVVLTLTPNNINGDVSEWHQLHLTGQQLLTSENNRAGSPLAGNIDINRRGLAGFSMGGGGVLLAGAELGDQVKAITAFAPFLLEEDRSSATPTAATLILAGDRDLLVTNESIEQIWQTVSGTAVTSALVKYSNGRHQQWYRQEFPQNRESYQRLTLEWLNLQLRDINGSASTFEALKAGTDVDNALISEFEYLGPDQVNK